MKTKLFYFLMVCIVMGMVIPAFAVSPDKNKGDKTKTENLSPSPLPPSPWTLHIQVTDPSDTCYAILYCNLGFFISPLGANCEYPSATPTATVPFHYGQANYYVPIPDSIQCVQVTMIDLTTPSCYYLFYLNPPCCKCKGDPTPCKFRICP
jgi:hypothetical protein